MYFDPGFGGMFVQVLIAIIAVGGGVIFSMRKKIKNLFNKDKSGTKALDNPALQETPDDAVDMLDDTVDVLNDEKELP